MAPRWNSPDWATLTLDYVNAALPGLRSRVTRLANFCLLGDCLHTLCIILKITEVAQFEQLFSTDKSNLSVYAKMGWDTFLEIFSQILLVTLLRSVFKNF
jgi:hypothetical protein